MTRMTDADERAQGKYATDARPVQEGCACHTCRNYTRAFLHHLIKVFII